MYAMYGRCVVVSIVAVHHHYHNTKRARFAEFLGGV